MKTREIQIIYRDGTKEKYYIDDYGIKDGCLYTYVRFGVEKTGNRHIPLDLIREYTVD